VNKRTYRAPFSSGLRASVIAVASCLALSGVSAPANAAGLGKIVVFSALGQPLRAEIEVSATAKELSDMKAQLASPETFKQAGLDYATSLLSIRFNLGKRADGQSVIKLTSDRPINDPFIDMLLELNWASGRLVREFTFLLDPPEMLSRAPAPVATVKAAQGMASGPSSKGGEIDADTRSRALSAVKGKRIPVAPVQEMATPEKQESHKVKQGETLRKIAVANKPDGVTLEQMLVGLLRANQEAFDGGNMNRLRAGKILSIPEKSIVESVSEKEARQIVVKQSSDWNAYRTRLAAVAAKSVEKDDLAQQEVSGKITARVEEKVAPGSDAKDQLKVSSTVIAPGSVAGTGKGAEEDLIAREQALKEANERNAMLEKNVAELQKLLELKSQNLAELQKQAAAKVEPMSQPPVIEAAKPELPPVPAPQADSTPAKTEPGPVPAAPVPPVVEKAPEPAAKPEPKSEPAAEMPKPKPKPVPPPPPPEEPGFFASLLDNPLTLAGGGGILALLAGLFYARRRRESKKEEAPLDLSSTLSPQSSGLSANSVFRNTGGQSVDTSHTPVHTDFSQAGPGSIDTDEVDPVAEADVYMAYGRDAQAEEILLEAKQKDPKRYAIHLKLLEIFANRADTGKFESLATELYGETSGVGMDWEKAAAMGRKLDPDNPMFKGVTSTANFDPNATVIVSSETIRNTVTMPGGLSQLTEVESGENSEAQDKAVKTETPDFNHLDFDLGSEDGVAPKEEGRIPGLSEPEAPSNVLDFDLGLEEEKPAQPSSENVGTESDAINVLDFDLGTGGAEDAEVAKLAADEQTSLPRAEEQRVELPELDFDISVAPSEAEKQLAEALEKRQGDDGLAFDVELDGKDFSGRSESAVPSFDMASIDLDLASEPEKELPIENAGKSEKVETEEVSQLVATNVNPDFEAMQSETMIVSSPVVDEVRAHDLENEDQAQLAATNVNPDFEAMQMETQLAVPPVIEEARSVSSVPEEVVVNPQSGASEEMLPEFEFNTNEEVATKLDLAKAYEEMGDLEGARELLNEVLNEGDTSQKENAQAILARIGG